MKIMCEKQIYLANRPKHSLKKPYLIQESGPLMHVERVKEIKTGKVRFRAVLQTAGDINQNKRLYPMDVLNDGIKRINHMIEKRNLIGELDHPISSDQSRQTTVLYKESSHLITKLWFDGNLLMGEIETLPYTPSGKILSGLILDGVKVGFSLRGLADLEDNGDHQEVLSPLVIICWDCVSNQSHKKASIQEVYQENVKVINESNSIIKCENGICYLAPNNNINDKAFIVENKLNGLYNKYWKPLKK